MADELRSQASKFPSLLGSQFVNSLAAQPGPISKAIQYLLSAIGIGVYNSGDQADVTWQVMNEFMEQYFPKRDRSTLSDVTGSYDLLLQKVPPGKEKPIFVFGALFESVAIFCKVFQLFLFYFSLQ